LGHIVNRPLKSTQKVVVQRQDVDGFYGDAFEEDFQDAINIQGKREIEVLFDPVLRNRVKIDFFLDGETVGWYEYKGHKAPDHSVITLTHGGESLHLVVKADIGSSIAAGRKNCTFAITGDYRIPVLVTLVKAAHLTQFRLLGYKYALSEAGRYLGPDLLGRFYLENHKKQNWDEVRNAALQFFRPYRTMMRPVAATDGIFSGTVDDNQILACIGSDGEMFATGVFVRARECVHMIIVPFCENTEAVRQYRDFLENSDEWFGVKLLMFDRPGACWRTDNSAPVSVCWPKKHASFDL
jgi:hypothetical protein